MPLIQQSLSIARFNIGFKKKILKLSFCTWKQKLHGLKVGLVYSLLIHLFVEVFPVLPSPVQTVNKSSTRKFCFTFQKEIFSLSLSLYIYILCISVGRKILYKIKLSIYTDAVLGGFTNFSPLHTLHDFL